MTLSSGAELDILTEGDPNGPKTLDDGYKSVAGSEGAAEASDKSGFSPTSTDEQHSVDETPLQVWETFGNIFLVIARLSWDAVFGARRNIPVPSAYFGTGRH